ncbi:filamin-A-interacting protein 1-like [Pholidichthys leucotaenia]
MRSKSSGVVPQSDCDIIPEQEVGLPARSLKAKVQQENRDPLEVRVITDKNELEAKVQQEENRNHVVAQGISDLQRGTIMDLSKEDLLRLLGIMEGELQAREDVINMLKATHTSPSALQSRNCSVAPGSVAPGSVATGSPLQALKRDGFIAGTKQHNDDLYQKPMIELEHLQKKHKQTYQRMLGQLLLVEKCHRRTIQELETEKRKHADYMNKSDDFTNLLEQDRERLKRLLENEKAYQAKKETEHTKRLAKLRDELVKLKSFALMLVNERQQHLEQMDQQSCRVRELGQQLQQQEQALKEAGECSQEDGRRVLSLEAELKEKSARLMHQHEEMNSKLASQEFHNRQLNAKLLGLTHKVEELEESNRALRRSDEELQLLREKISKGECDNGNLIAELENLQKRVLEMEGKDEEITKTENQCKELKKSLQEEDGRSKDLRMEVEMLQKRMMELEKLEDTFSASKVKCAQLQKALEQETGLTKELSDEVVTLKIRMKELESSELKLEKSELSLKDDLSKLKSLTIALMDERKTLIETVKSDEKKKDDLNRMVKIEQSKVMEVTEKLIEDSKNLLRFKSEMESKVEALTLEKGELATKLASEMEKTKDLNSKVSQMKKKLEEVEQAEMNSLKNDQDNKVNELTFEIERLKNRLKELEVVEIFLMRTEDQCDVSQRRLVKEQDMANVLSQQVKETRNQFIIKKGEKQSQEEDLLRLCCDREEAKNRELQADVLALKEKIHELMHKEDQLSQLQVDFAVLQQRFLEEEEKAKNMGAEVFHLTEELEVVKRHSRVLRPGLNGRRMVDVAMTSTGVQTEGSVEEDTPAGFIRKSVQEENNIMSNLRQKCLKRTTVERSPSSGSDLGIKRSWIPWMRKKDSNPQETNSPQDFSSEMAMPPNQGHPLHIRVTPDRLNNTATLEISSPTTEDVFSSSAALSPNPSQPKPRITVIPTCAASAIRRKSPAAPQGPERAKSPFAITTVSRAKSPESGRAYSTNSRRPLSPVSVTVAVPKAPKSLEPQEMTMGRAVFRVTPEKQMVPVPMRKSHNNTGNITTTDDNKIHVGNGVTPKTVVRAVAAAAESKEMTLSTGTVLRSPRHITTTTMMTRSSQSKLMSSITISSAAAASSRPTPSLGGPDVQLPRSGSTRIPMSKSLKTGKATLGSVGGSGDLKLETRTESQTMRIDMKKTTINNNGFINGGKA